ncbi:MAG: glycoside hydrolase family 2 TIM barrel-domain containing protein [Chitinophagaceae bacterium]
MKIRLIYILALSLCSQIVSAQQKIRLINNWEFLKQDIGGMWEIIRPVSKGGPENVPLWQPVTLPHCVNAEDAVDPDVNYYQGPAWYRTRLSIQNPYNGGRTLLHFEGAGQKTEVYIYDTKVGSHTGGYDEFTIDITDAVDAFSKTDVFKKQFNGQVPIAIRTDNSRDLEMIPSNLSDFNLYGGIYRYLNLVYTPVLSIDKIFAIAQTDKSGKTGKLTITSRFYNPLHVQQADITVNVIDPKGKLLQQLSKNTILTGDVTLAELNVKNLQLWSPELPQLYNVEVIIKTVQGEYKQSEKVGFRNFEFVDYGPFMLNGKRLLLRGTHRHEDHAGVASAMTEEMMRAEMILMKEMGVNFIRLGHYQQSRIILNLCDSLGILVWEEIPWCRGGLGGENYKAQAKRMLTNMIEQHYNHPAVIIWGLGNENDWPGDFTEFDKDKIRAFMSNLNDLAHSLDPSRKTAIRRCDFCKDIVDVYSPSMWMGWYRSIYTEYKQTTMEEMKKVKHFLHIEWGGDTHAGRNSENPDRLLQQIISSNNTGNAGNDTLFAPAARAAKNGDANESYLCNLVDWHLKEQETMPLLTGTAQWPFKDFSTPVRPDSPVPYMNQKGIVERDLTKKEVYYVFQSYWTTQPMAHIFGHDWPVRWGDMNEEKMLKVYSNCDEAELILNGKSLGIKKRNSQDYPAAGLRWNTILNKGSNSVKVIAKKGKTTVTDSISFQYQADKWGKPAKILFEKIKEENGVATVKATLLDEKNVLCIDAANWIRFGLTGDGKLIDDQGTSSGSRYVQLYNGRAIIRIKTNNGKSVMSAKVEGVETVMLEL